MGLFGFKKNNNTPAPAQASAPASTPAQASAPAPSAAPMVDLGKKTGALSLRKGEAVTIEKAQVITARCTWSSSTDYDLYALVLLKNGKTLVVSTFGSVDQRNPTPSVLNGAVRHMGDVARGAVGVAEETIEIRMTDEIEAVYPIAYSAQSNGSGSFRKYQVSCAISNGAGSEVTIDAKNASANNGIYTQAIGAIRNTADGVRIEALEEYSRPGSENRPAIVGGRIVMDAGSKNLYK